jgi:hypothetical protein
VLDDLLTRSLAALMAEGLVTLEEIIVHGTKVKASAGKSSLERASGLDGALSPAKERVAALKAEVDAEPGGSISAARQPAPGAAGHGGARCQACPRGGGGPWRRSIGSSRNAASAPSAAPKEMEPRNSRAPGATGTLLTPE